MRSAAPGSGEVLLVGLHVRRTDYIHFAKTVLGKNIASKAFYREAMDYFEEEYPDNQVGHAGKGAGEDVMVAMVVVVKEVSIEAIMARMLVLTVMTVVTVETVLTVVTVVTVLTVVTVVTVVPRYFSWQ